MKWIEHKLAVPIVCILLALAGAVAALRIPVVHMPSAERPGLQIQTHWGRVPADVVERSVTRPIEREIGGLDGVRSVRSETSQGVSRVEVEFDPGTPIAHRQVELRERLDHALESLAGRIEHPDIERLVPGALREGRTFMAYTLEGEVPDVVLERIAHSRIVPMLRRLDGIADVRLHGQPRSELRIRFHRDPTDPLRQLSTDSVLAWVLPEAAGASLGLTARGTTPLPVRFDPAASDPLAMAWAGLPIDGALRTAPLREWADVGLVDAPPVSFRRFNGNPSLVIEVVRLPGADAITLSTQIRAEMQTLSATLPDGVAARLTVDATDPIRSQLRSLLRQGLLSLLLVFATMAVLLRGGWGSSVILGSVALSVLTSLASMHLLGLTLDSITLAGLTISFGMMLDNAVVVHQVIVPGLSGCWKRRARHITDRLPRAVVPVAGSTMTSLCIFIPLLHGVQELRDFLLPLALVLTLSLGASAWFSFTWIPFALLWLPPRRNPVDRAPRSGTLFGVRALLAVLLIRHRHRVALVALHLFAALWVATRFAASAQPESVFPPAEQTIRVSVEPAHGVPLERLLEMVRPFETLGKEHASILAHFEAIGSVYTGASVRYVLREDSALTENAHILLGRAMGLAVLTGNAAVAVGGLGTAFSTGQAAGATGYPITLGGPSHERILAYAERLSERLAAHRRVRDVDLHAQVDDRPGRSRDYRLRFDESRLAALGLDPQAIARDLSLELGPADRVGQVHLESRRVPVSVSLAADAVGRTHRAEARPAESSERWMDRVRVSGGTRYRLSEVAELDLDPAQPVIRRTDMQYERMMEIQWLGNPHSVARHVARTIDAYPPPPDVRVLPGEVARGGWAPETRRNAWLLLGLAFALVWGVLCALLESWTAPIPVMASIPFAAFGIMAGVVAHELPLGRGALAGALLCMGVCVNNALLLASERRRLRCAGLRRLRALAHLYCGASRAIAVTTATTIAGLLPMAMLGRDPFWTPFAWVVLWGLASSTLLHLLFTGIGIGIGVRTQRDRGPGSDPSSAPDPDPNSGLKRDMPSCTARLLRLTPFYARAAAASRSSANSHTETRSPKPRVPSMVRSWFGTPPPSSGPDPPRNSG